MSLLSTSVYLLAVVVCVSLTKDVLGNVSNASIRARPESPAVQPAAVQFKIPSRTPTAGTSTSTDEDDLRLVHSFVDYFNQSVQADPKLKNAFAIDNLKATGKKFYYDLAYEVHAGVGDLKPQYSAKVVADAVAAKIDKVTTDSHILIYAFSSGYLMYGQGAITPESVIYLSQEIYRSTKRAVYSVTDTSPAALVKGVVKGMVIDFLIFNGFFRADNAQLAAVTFANEWYKSSK